MTELWLRIAMTSYYPNSASKIGVGWVAQRLANAIVERGHSVTMFSVLGSRFSVLGSRCARSEINSARRGARRQFSASW